MSSVPVVTAAAVKDRARAAGFDLCGISPVAAFPELDRFAAWLDLGYAGEMSYLHRTAEKRRDVRGALPSARSVIVPSTITERADGSAPRTSRRLSAVRCRYDISPA